MNIALCHFRVGETDGVSLEMDKWKLTLEKMGHNVCYIAGSEGTTESYIIEELHYAHPENNLIVKNAYSKLEDFTDKELLEKIESMAKVIEEKLVDLIQVKKIDILVPNNIWSLGWGLPAGIGFAKAVFKTETRCIVHNHDFYWERDKYSNPTIPEISDLIEEFFPPKAPYIQHCVINRIAQQEMKERKDIDAVVVPNVFDFKADLWKPDEYNGDFRERIGVGKNDILLLQATRITERKAIELAVDCAGELNRRLREKEITLFDGREFSKSDRVVFVLAGLPEAEVGYSEKLIKKAEDYGLNILFCNDVIDHSRNVEKGRKIYSLWDAYVHADFITYPSILEGWGNQFLEGVFAEKPMVVYEYPVYLTDIKRHGFNIVSLGDSYRLGEHGLVEVDREIIDNAVKEIERLITDKKLRDEAVTDNFRIASENFSYESLYTILKELFR